MLKQWWARAVVGRTSVSDPLQEPERPDARFEAEWRSLIKTRLVVILGVLAVWAVSLEARLVYIQVLSHEEYAGMARRQQEDMVALEAPRGDIVDRNGQLLAYSVDSVDVHANPKLVADPAVEAREVCAAFGDCSADELTEIVAKLSKPKRDVVIRGAREMSPDATNGVRALISARAEAAKKAKTPTPVSLRLDTHTARYYPKRELAATVIGFLTDDGKGGAGVESRFNDQISGIKGRALTQVDGRPEERRVFTQVQTAPRPGDSLELTIDVALQHIAERELQAGLAAAEASAGSAIILDSRTGEILAEASFPTFNPNVLAGTSDNQRRNRAVQDLYEPGSTMKIVTASAALNEGIFAPSDLIDTNPGSITFPGRLPIREAHGHNYHVLSLQDVVVQSSNVGAVRIGLKVGPERMLHYLRGFGFGQKLAPDFRGEQPGFLTSLAELNDSALASTSIGYQVSVTPMQMVSAANVIATGGWLLEPHLIRSYTHDGHRTQIERKVLGQAIAPETALAMTTILESVVQDGTGKHARLERYSVAGKTGTASKVVDRKYSKTDYNVSFVGFVPSRRPVFTILVVVDSPRKGERYGGTVAGPIFRRIADAALQYAGVPPTINPVPPILVPPTRPVVPAPPPVASEAKPVLTKVGGRPVMPDLHGMSMRDAVRVAKALGLEMTIEGDGAVVSQTPLPGAVLDASVRVTFQLRRGPLPPAGSDR